VTRRVGVNKIPPADFYITLRAKMRALFSLALRDRMREPAHLYIALGAKLPRIHCESRQVVRVKIVILDKHFTLI